MKATAFTLLLISLLLLSSSAQSQRLTPRSEFSRENSLHRNLHSKAEFTFARLRYEGIGWRESWTTDYPKADFQFVIGLRNWCRSSLDIADDPTTTGMEGKEIFEYPFVYAVEPGHMTLSEKDAAQLREYLTRGGFLMLDDFWGEYEWQNVQEQMRKVFPEYPIRELPLDHPIFHCYFDIDEVVQVPNVNYIYTGVTSEKGGYIPHYEGITDDTGRVVVFIARNCDNGDAWEWIDEPRYPLKFGLAAYRLGMNVIVYAMTH